MHTIVKLQRLTRFLAEEAASPDWEGNYEFLLMLANGGRAAGNVADPWAVADQSNAFRIRTAPANSVGFAESPPSAPTITKGK